MLRSLLLASLTLEALAPCALAAQVIPIRTVPVASGDQYLILPSRSLAMGGVHLAIDDSLADGWSNPAQGIYVTESAFLGSPTVYSISRGGGGGRTFPVAGLFAGSQWFGGAALALQQIENGSGDRSWFARAFDVCCLGCCGPEPRALSDRFGRNVYAQGFIGRRVAPEWSIGLGGSVARLGAMDGVDLLYAGSERIDQAGHQNDIRLGAHYAGARDRLSLVAFRGDVEMSHEVTWREAVWDPVAMRTLVGRRVDINEDRTRTWGSRLSWDRALEAPGWRVGAAATVNYKDHPKIPNYTIQNIPRDPGTTWAYEAALGFSRSGERSTFALDFALQPIWSETWQEADAQDVVDSDQRLGVGDRSIENDFFFTNVVIRAGLVHQVGPVDLLAGIGIASYAYHLEQVDNVRISYREQDEEWIEWSPSLGANFRFEALELRYTGRVTTGTGTPGTRSGVFAGPGEQLAGGGSPDFLLAPDAPLTLVDARVTTHQLSVRVPIR